MKLTEYNTLMQLTADKPIEKLRTAEDLIKDAQQVIENCIRNGSNPHAIVIHERDAELLQRWSIRNGIPLPNDNEYGTLFGLIIIVDHNEKGINILDIEESKKYLKPLYKY